MHSSGGPSMTSITLTEYLRRLGIEVLPEPAVGLIRSRGLTRATTGFVPMG